jgi:diguanylate cyclase (GGDEF)-like protein
MSNNSVAAVRDSFMASADKPHNRGITKEEPTVFYLDKASHEQEGENNNEQADLLDILENGRIKTLFQPIFNLLAGDVYAYEALSRVTGPSPFYDPEVLFMKAKIYGLDEGLETLCIRTAIETASRLELDRIVTLNICPSMLYRHGKEPRDISPVIKELYDLRQGVILELTERHLIADDSDFTENLRFLQATGYRIAIDDLGCGFAGLRMLSQIEPAIVKVDRFLISDVRRSTQKRMLLESIVSFCHKINALVVAEGIETEGDLRVLMDLKVDLGQGYLLGRPEERIQECPSNVMAIISSYGNNMTAKAGYQCNDLGSLAQFVEPVQSADLVETLVERFEGNRELMVIPVVDGHKPVGIVNKHNLFHVLGQRFGRSLHMRKEAGTIMETVLIIDSGTTLDDVSRTILKRDESQIYDAVVVLHAGVYAGIVKVYRILEAITEQKLSMALQANPLTGLPGNNLIKEEISSRLSGNRIFAVLYFDLDNFKPFNDCFGFEQGDMVIGFLGGFLQERLKQWDPMSFLGHIGGDDFVGVSRVNGVEGFCEALLDDFQRGIRSFHDAESMQRGYYLSADRQGNHVRFDLLSLSIAVVSTGNRAFSSYSHLVSVASEVKKKAKQIRGNSVYIDKRTE